MVRSRAECDAWMKSGRRLYLSDGPLKMDYIAEIMIGRVIGLYEALTARPQLALPS